MKTLIIAFILSFHASAEVTFQDCLDDSQLSGNHIRPVTPLPECATILDSETGKVESVSGNYRAYGKSHLVFVDSKDADGNVIVRVLLAGDQTELLSVQKLFIDSAANRLFVIQLKDGKNELMVYQLDFLGNVTPLNVMRSETLFVNVSSVKVLGDKIEIINGVGTYLINSDAESRTTRSLQKALVVTPI